MASDIDSVPSRLAPGPDSDHLPLAARRSHLLRPPPAPRAEPPPPTPDRREASPAPEGTRGAAQQSWPGLPRGVEFNPSDSDLLWHLAAEIGNGLAHRHPFISEFIKSGDEDGGFGRTHPQDMPGMTQDGHASYFFHKKVNLYNNKSDKYISWQKSGASRSIILDGNLQGCKELFVLYAFKNSDDSPQRTDWELHQYHIKNRMEDEGELVVSKIFYKSQNNHCELAEKAHVQAAQDDYVTGNSFKEEKVDTQSESHSVNMAMDSNYKGNGNNQEKILVQMYPDQDKQSSCKDVLVTTYIDHENQMNNQTETELDHMSLQERYRILLANRHSCSARVSAEACTVNDLDNSSMQMNAETSGPVPKSESEEINREGTAYREDICSMLQEISSPPSITDSMDADNNVRLLGEIPLDTQRSSVECFVNGKEVRCDSAGDAECPVNDKTLNSPAELLSSQTLPYGDENVHLAVRNSGTSLVDVKMEPALEGYAVYPSESPCVNSHHSNNDDLKDSGTVPECSETDFTHAEGSLPSLVVKSELTGYELPGLCENSLINSMQPTVKKTHTRTPNCNEGLPYCSRQRKKRKNAMDSSEKVHEKDAYENDEGVAYPCRRRRKKKTATDSIETALEEDAPGLLQILLDRGIVLKEIKLYDVGEVDDMLPECTESDFQDLENVITKLFPQRASLLKAVARNVKGGGKAIYCLACLISLIEQSRYLQFRDCPVEWGWCRDLQSFIFVFRSHNRLVLERPEYGYATYFFEIVQSVPIEWQIRRLVTAMKLSSCGRTALIENRPLLVGEDLSEGEARVLEEYGWIPNTGLGTMLNYRDRVVHDRWNENYSTDWRMKIGRLLMNGYSQGHCIISHVPTDMLSEEEIKLEDPL